MVLWWCCHTKEYIRGLVLAGKSCYDDFRSFIPPTTLVVYEAFYGSSLTEEAIPAMFRERVTSLVLQDAKMEFNPNPKVKAVHLRRLKLFPRISSVEVLPAGITMGPQSGSRLGIGSKRMRKLLRFNEFAKCLGSGCPIPGSVRVEEREIPNLSQWDLTEPPLGTKAFEVLTATRPDISLTIKWTFCLFHCWSEGSPVAAFSYQAVEEILGNGDSQIHYADLYGKQVSKPEKIPRRIIQVIE